jgi:DNA-binding HxlR family transcriptional regulator
LIAAHSIYGRFPTDAARDFDLKSIKSKRCTLDSLETRSLLREVSLRIVTHLDNGPARFSEIAALPGTPNPPLLAKHLRRLVRDGIITRTIVAIGPPANVSYSLTDLGRSMVAPAAAMIAWLDRHRPLITAARALTEPRPKEQIVDDEGELAA